MSTGFGALSTTRIPRDRWGELQESLVLSHAAGIGRPLEREVVRALMFLRARTLALGFSGVRPDVVDAIVGVLNSGYTPVVPEHGSLGASGDLAPLAHASLVLLGLGEVTDAAGERAGRRGTRSRRRVSSRSFSGPRRGSRSSTGPTGCSGC